MDFRRRHLLLHGDRPLEIVNLDHGAEPLAAHLMDIVAFANRGVLRLELIDVDGRLVRAAVAPDERQPRETRLLVAQFVLAEVAQAEVLPPRGLRLAAMPVQQVRRQPARLLFVRTLRAVVHAVKQTRFQRLHLQLALGERLDFRGLNKRPRRLLAAFDEAAPQILQPVAEAERRDAIVAVVLLDDAPHLPDGAARVRVGLQLEDAPRLQQTLQRMAVVVRRVEVNFPRVAVELLQVLDGVALDACEDRLPRRRVQVNEEFGAQHPVHFLLARRVAPHQPLERARLVGREMVDTQIGMRLAPSLDVVYELLENRLLPGGETPALPVRPERPARVILRLPVRAERRPAEQVLEALRPHERRALNVEEHVAGRRRRQPREAALRFAGTQFVVRRAALAPLQLDARLLAGAFVRRDGAPLRPPRERKRLFGEPRQRLDAPTLNLPLLAGREPRDEREVVVSAAPPAAIQPPPADVAVRDGLRIRRNRLRLASAPLADRLL